VESAILFDALLFPLCHQQILYISCFILHSAAGAFGVIALVAMTPLIAIQILGIIFKLKTRKKEVKQ